MNGRTSRPIPLIGAFVVIAMAACGVDDGAGVSEEVEEVRIEGVPADSMVLPWPELERAREVSAALAQDLAGLVFRTLEEDSPSAAVRVCSEIAQERTSAYATDGVYVRRVSDRLRNPLNAPDPEEARELERLRALTIDGKPPAEIIRIVRQGPDRKLHLIRPILVQPPCLTCHGDPAAIPTEVANVLDERYPEDRAIGYRAGELRGAISIRVPIAEER